MRKNGTALAIGAFDGLHTGHIKVINSAVNFGDLKPAVLSFNENPTVALLGKSAYLATQKQKETILKNLGVKDYFGLDFSSVKNMSPSDFFNEIIVAKCNAKAVFCGENFHFGKNAQGNTETLQQLCDENDIKLVVVPFAKYDDYIISSTRIRNCIENGDMPLTRNLLGRYFSFELMVVKGNQIGRTLGTPTINQIIPNGFVLPKFGVYASIVTVDGVRHCGVTNVGTKPSIGKYQPSAETWIMDFKKDMYGMEIKVELVEFIRNEKKFSSLDELKEEIYNNAKTAKAILSNIIGG